MKKVTQLLLALGCLTLLPSTYAQSGGATTAKIIGSVKDEQMSVIGGATVTAKNILTNFTREVISGEDGSYVIPQMPPGNYVVTVQADGFVGKNTNVELLLGNTAFFNVTLSLGSASEIIEVKANQIVIADQTESSINIGQERIDNLPINRRDFLDFSLTAARVTTDRAPGQGASVTSKLSFNGQSARANNITIDGLDNNDNGSGSVRATFSQDAIQEFQVISDNYSAEFGRALGGIVNIVTRGGTNSYKGSLFFFNRNDSLNAREVFASFKAPYRQYQFGSTLGGPIKQDKAFFFLSFERLSIKQNNIVTISDTTVKAARNIGLPLSNGPSAFSQASSNFLIRTDFRLNSNNLLYVRYNFGGAYNGALEPFGGLVGQTNSGVQKLTDNSLAISNTYVNTGLNLTNEARFLFGPRDQDVLPVNEGPQIRLVAPEGLVTFGRGTFLPQTRDMKTYQFIDNVSLVRGRHQLKVGVDYTYITLNDLLPIFPGGLAFFQPIDFAAATGIPGLPSFSGLETFDPNLRSPQQRAFLTVASNQFPIFFPGFPRNLPLADLSLPTAYIQGFGSATGGLNTKLFAAFAQDDIKVKSNLLVKLGLRYDLHRVNSVPNNNGNFSPRIGFSYSPKNIENLRIHGAYGLFFAVPLTGTPIGVLLNNTNRLSFPAIPFPFAILPFSRPTHHYPDGNEVPSDLPVDPAFNSKLLNQKDLRNSYAQHIDFSASYLFNANTLISFSYNFIRGVKLYGPRNINPVVRPVPGDPVASVKTGRPIPNVGDIPEFSSIFDSYFHGGTISLSRRLANNFTFLAHYTFSKAIDNTVDFRPDLQEAVDTFRLDLERGLSLQDVRQRFVFSGLWNLDYSKKALLSGYQLSTIISLESGHPFNLLAGSDLNLSGDAFNPTDRPIVGGVSIGRNTGELPGFANIDLRLTKKITFKENINISGFVEVFNLVNRTNISEVDRIFPPDRNGNFNLPPQENGRYKALPERFRNAFSPRQFQVGFRFTF